MADIVLSVASKVAEYLVAPVGRQCGYVILTNSYVGELKEELVQLENARQRVQHSIDGARNNMKPIEADVEEWMKKVETVANKVRDVLDYDGRAKKTCFCGWLPNPKERYSLGRDARKTVQAIQALIPQGKFERVYYERDPSGLVGGALDVNSLAVDGGNIIIDSRASIFQGIMKALDDEKLKVIGVYGPGGVGKTTLLEEVEKKVRKEKRPFDMIAKAKVSQNLDLKKIQDDIAYAFGLNLKDEPSEEGRRDLLFRKIQSESMKNVLIILDDLWDKLDLKAVGIPTGDESRGCKLLLSSRFKDVLEQKMHTDPTFLLEGLNNDEAFRLFEKTVGDRLKDEEELKPIAAQVVKKLAGLPLLITSVASTLKYGNVSAWRNALIKLEEPNIETIVKLSYNHLKSEDAKSLFLLCGLISGTIRVENLFILSMGLGLFEGFNKMMKDARDRLNTTLDDLRSACLLLDGGDDEGNVTIHDLYSEVVVSTPFRGQNSLMMNNNYGSWSKEKLEKCWAICLMDIGSDRLAELMRCGFPHLKVLMLSQPGDWMGRPAHRHDEGDCCRLDFTYMKQLRALLIRSMHIPTFPSSIQILENLQSLYLDRCNVEDVAILGKLKALQILSFARSMISKLPKEIGDLMNLKSLNLSNCSFLATIELGVLKGLINLEELLMDGSFHRWMGNDEVPWWESRNAKLAELKSLTKLTALEIWIPDPTVLLGAGDLPFGNLIRFWINIGHVYHRREFGWREFYDSRTMVLTLEGCDGILSKEWIQKTLHKTQHLHLDGLREFKKSANELCIRGFPQLKHLHIKNSPSIEYIANSSNGLPLTAFTKLESLFLGNLTNLERIWNGPAAPDCFSKLKTMRIEKCHRLKSLGFLSETQGLTHLEEIEVRDCDSLQAFITDDGRIVEVAADDRVVLPNVRRLDLSDLPNMTSICTGAEGAPIQVSLPNLEKLTLFSVTSLKRIWHGELSRSSFCELATLTLENCTELLNVFPSTITGRLHNLKKVIVSGCPSLKSLFDCGSLDSNTEQTRVLLPKLELVFVQRCPSLESLFDRGSLDSNTEQTIVLLPKLEELTVEEAHKLRHVVQSGSQTVWAFPSLKKVRVALCSELRYLFPYSTAATLEELEQLEISDCEQMKGVVRKEEGGRSKVAVMSFPSLAHVIIERCHNFGAFIPSPTSVQRKLPETAEENDELPQPLFNEMVKLPNITSLQIEDAPCKELWNNQISDDSFCKLEFLRLKHCDNLQRVAPSHMWKRLQRHLDILQVESCCSIEIIYEDDKTATESGTLRRLVLRDLENLRHIWRSNGLPNVPLPSLRFIEVQCCPHLRMLFPTFTGKFLGQIQELVVESCEDMELVAGHEESEETSGTAITFSELTALRLFKLPKFGSFLPDKYSVEFPSLQVLSRVSCGTEPDQGDLDDWESYQRGRVECRATFRQY